MSSLYEKPSKGQCAVLALGIAVTLLASGTPEMSPKSQPAASAVSAVSAPIPATGSVVYDTGALADRRAGDLYAVFLGYKGSVVPEQITIDWGAHLDAMWGRKANRKGATSVVHQARAALVAEYNISDPGRISLDSYQAIAANQAAAICAELDWKQVAKAYRLNERESRLLKRVSCNIGGRTLLAYAMTELLPSTDGELNREYLDFMLRHGGRQYVESLPALHDDITSFGPFQFTQFAVYDARGGPRGASKVNASLPERLQIPGSTIKLRGTDHLRAAYLFAISNLADGIRGLSSKQLTVFERVAGSRGIEVAQFIAVAHNKPAPARRALKNWLNAGARGGYRDHCSRVSRLYATKTLHNYKALSPTSS